MGDEAKDAFDHPQSELETDSESETDEDEDEGEDSDEEMDEAEVEQPENKRRGEGEAGQADEEEGEPKRQKVEDHKDHDFMAESQISETGYGNNELATVFYGLDFDGNDSGDEKDEIFWPLHVHACKDKTQDGINCLKVDRCDLILHNSRFRGLPVFELLKVKLILNEERNQSLSGKLYGEIESRTSSENPDPISYFSVKKENALPIHLGPGNNSISLPLYFPKAKPLTIFCNLVSVRFAFKFEYENDDKTVDVLEEYGLFSPHDQVYYDDGYTRRKAKSFFLCVRPFHVYRGFPGRTVTEMLAYPNSDIMRVAARYGIYDGAWATVAVRILKEDVSKYYGFIFARPCIFKSRIRLLSIPKEDQMCELHESKYVVLARQVVAVPTFCSLVISALLYDQDGEEIVRDKTLFKVLPPGAYDTKPIGKDRVCIEIEWNCNISEWIPWLPGAACQ